MIRCLAPGWVNFAAGALGFKLEFLAKLVDHRVTLSKEQQVKLVQEEARRRQQQQREDEAARLRQLEEEEKLRGEEEERRRLEDERERIQLEEEEQRRLEEESEHRGQAEGQATDNARQSGSYKQDISRLGQGIREMNHSGAGQGQVPRLSGRKIRQSHGSVEDSGEQGAEPLGLGQRAGSVHVVVQNAEGGALPSDIFRSLSEKPRPEAPRQMPLQVVQQLKELQDRKKRLDQHTRDLLQEAAELDPQGSGGAGHREPGHTDAAPSPGSVPGHTPGAVSPGRLTGSTVGAVSSGTVPGCADGAMSQSLVPGSTANSMANQPRQKGEGSSPGGATSADSSVGHSIHTGRGVLSIPPPTPCTPQATPITEPPTASPASAPPVALPLPGPPALPGNTGSAVRQPDLTPLALSPHLRGSPSVRGSPSLGPTPSSVGKAAQDASALSRMDFLRCSNLLEWVVVMVARSSPGLTLEDLDMLQLLEAVGTATRTSMVHPHCGLNALQCLFCIGWPFVMNHALAQHWRAAGLPLDTCLGLGQGVRR